MDGILDAFAWFIRAPFICCGWIIAGAIAGDLARRVMGVKDRGVISDFILGISGAIIGGMITGLLGLYRPETGIIGVLTTMIIAIIGSAILIAIGQAIGIGGKRQKRR